MKLSTLQRKISYNLQRSGVKNANESKRVKYHGRMWKKMMNTYNKELGKTEDIEKVIKLTKISNEIMESLTRYLRG